MRGQLDGAAGAPANAYPQPGAHVGLVAFFFLRVIIPVKFHLDFFSLSDMYLKTTIIPCLQSPLISLCTLNLNFFNFDI